MYGCNYLSCSIVIFELQWRLLILWCKPMLMTSSNAAKYNTALHTTLQENRCNGKKLSTHQSLASFHLVGLVIGIYFEQFTDQWPRYMDSLNYKFDKMTNLTSWLINAFVNMLSACYQLALLNTFDNHVYHNLTHVSSVVFCILSISPEQKQVGTLQSIF